jgi:hypothetical protein
MLMNWRNGNKKVRGTLFGHNQAHITEDQVQFFCAKAEYERWQEQVEINHAEMHCCIRYFDRFNQIWLQLAEETTLAAHAAYAWWTASMYQKLRSRVEKVLKATGLEMFINLAGQSLVDVVLAWCQAEHNIHFKGVNYFCIPESPAMKGVVAMVETLEVMEIRGCKRKGGGGGGLNVVKDMSNCYGLNH